ncbi:MAG: Ig-like domain-containing protein [Oscillospiraceae bacterium]|nr:Ig-like domain-containing protein [Oscillospiraceae bacterium]
MKRRIISASLSAALAASAFAGLTVVPAAAAEAKTPQYQEHARQMEKLNRGLVAVYTTADTRGQTVNGVVLSWRLLGDEDLTNQAFDIYRNGTKIKTTGAHDATYYRDTAGTATSTYKVVKAGASAEEVAAEPAVTPTTQFSYAKPSEVGSGASHPHSFTYVDIPISMPTDIGKSGTTALSDYKRTSGAGGANDASVGDLDGDGDYEIVLKWDPIDSKDSTRNGVTGHCVIDAYEIDPNNTGYKWRIDLGNNVTAGAHYTQYIVYDFDGDGKAEVAMTTAPGSYSIDINGEKHYVTEVGDTDEIRNADNNADNLANGKNIGPEYYTIFSGETGRPLKTTMAILIGDRDDGKEWGQNLRNESHRYLAGVAYLDGVHPSYIACRGYYYKAVIRAYTWDGQDFTMLWEHDGSEDSINTMYGQGNHNMSIADIDNDGKDEIVWGSACLDDDGKTVLGNTRSGHGDAMHVSDFTNNGVQEVFSVKEKSQGKPRGADFRVAETGEAIWSKAVTGDNGRGVMDNIDDAYAAENPDGLALGWSAAHAEAYDLKGNAVGAKPSSAGKGDFCNFLVYWDGDLGRELLDANIIQKYDAKNGTTKRFFGPSDGYTLSGETNNDTKRNYCLVADLWGDWREEIIMAVGDSDPSTAALRIFTSITPTDYRLTTLMHDCQYREAIAWQNVGYNQPPHTSYYIGSAALATDASGNKLNYLAPATPFTKVTYEAPSDVAVTGVTISPSSVNVEKGKTVNVKAEVSPFDASKKSVIWSSANEAVATVANGIITGVSEGKTTITATTVDGGFTATCEVTVYANHVTAVSVDPKTLELGTGMTKQVKAVVEPSTATDQSVTWTSGDESVITVDKNGNVTAVGKQGSTFVMATTNDGGLKAYCYVVVYELSETDVTGSDSFVTSNTDAETKVTVTANSAAVTQDKATAPVEFHKDFEAYSDNKATLAFHFTTGGGKADVGDYIWKAGHGYTSELKFLDTNGNNILNILEEHTTSGVATKYIVAGGDKQNASTWTKVKAAANGNTAFNRSQIRWDVKAEFDYGNDTATITLAGCDSSWVTDETWQLTFPLNGASFKTLKYDTTDITDWVSQNPKLEDLTYTRISASGEAPTFMPEITPGPTDKPEPKNSLVIKSVDGKTANVEYSVADARDGAVLIGALYGEDGSLAEVKVKDIESLEASKEIADSIEFTNDIENYDLKVFLWDSLEGMKPICSAALPPAPAPEVTDEPTPDVTDEPAPATLPPTENPTPVVTDTPEPTNTPEPTSTPEPTPTPTPVAPLVPDEEYTEVFTSTENFLMENDAENNKWIRSADSKTESLSETTDDIGGNATAKIALANQAVQYVLDEALTDGYFKLTYDMYINKGEGNSYGRYFRTYLDNDAHPFDALTGKASEYNADNAFFHMMDLHDLVYTTSDASLVSAKQDNESALIEPEAKKLSPNALAGAKWYRTVIEGSLRNDGIVIVKIYPHGDTYQEDLDISAVDPVIATEAYYTDGRARALKQIKFMRTAGGTIYYDNIKLEKADSAN